MGPIGYQWLADGQAIANATGASFTLTALEVGKHLSVLASYVDSYGTHESAASAPTAAVAPQDLNWTGSATVPTCSPQVWATTP